MNFLFAFSFVFLIVYLTIPFFEKLSIKWNFVDKPNERKKHQRPIPLLGGIGMFFGFISGYITFIRPIDKQSVSVIVASILILIIGIIDDWYKTLGKEFPALPRLLVHIISAIIVFSSGIVFYGFTNPVTHKYIILPYIIQFVLSIMWIVGVTTVINWSDGIDGLAGRLSAIAGSTLFVVALAKGQDDSALLSALIVGVSLGFLRYNKHPARIFMGDSGANFLGFILSIIALNGAFKQATLISLSIPVLALGVPIFDNIIVVLKRFSRGESIYKADATQIHHRLLSSGLTQKQTVAFISLISVCFSLISIIILLLKV
ncbi:UDP-N-acetylmuramyl pentapeptide phosphotransferase/UDP-N-acetylglucosamine-1-phosphate transferase [Desulfosporosinus acidiphilus SJ4]|uniref:UDP-N-acetylmuramyl pentapeptide phosphotransferase/UDP-N-acetylglucosamine-1-phosphate transferase n=1 Tax=Desulfosporosinus acidiphilus (strain DSM 22704 / JCM 16185 / SJ4) TaxID=646529 RepID=I4D0F1_DESAJ|nr:MraY family glycosyltransferase [Desulfosporosinus acidiphilus]AFM39275.1 UDP-N-acetylmuramyl pentapeptide phosphotransferase/UDP-N-acetylglucosamine-1-phosphate transferase [Desulfosporosinus acidiphilus SJ4]